MVHKAEKKRDFFLKKENKSFTHKKTEDKVYEVVSIKQTYLVILHPRKKWDCRGWIAQKEPLKIKKGSLSSLLPHRSSSSNSSSNSSTNSSSCCCMRGSFFPCQAAFPFCREHCGLSAPVLVLVVAVVVWLIQPELCATKLTCKSQRCHIFCAQLSALPNTTAQQFDSGNSNIFF